MVTIIICPKCYSIHWDEKELTDIKVIGKLILPKSFVYVKVINYSCKKCRDETES